jgi:aspartyl protease family protein
MPSSVTERLTPRRYAIIRSLVGGLLLTAASVQGAVPLEIVGLFKDTAVIREGGRERMLRAGDTSASGVTLISANSREAVVSYQGERQTVSLSEGPVGAGGYAQATAQSVSIPADSMGQYRIRGAINNRYVDFLIDTGASVVALSSITADTLGIDYTRGQRGSVQTAQGNAESHFLTLDTVTVAGITAHHVQAAIITGSHPQDILLGMSFLRQVSMRENGGVLTLVQKY